MSGSVKPAAVTLMSLLRLAEETFRSIEVIEGAAFQLVVKETSKLFAEELPLPTPSTQETYLLIAWPFVLIPVKSHLHWLVPELKEQAVPVPTE